VLNWALATQRGWETRRALFTSVVVGSCSRSCCSARWRAAAGERRLGRGRRPRAVRALGPLGVGHDADPPRDEYEGYAAGVLALVLAHGQRRTWWSEHLARLEDRWMGLAPSPLGRRLAVAAAVREAVRDARGAAGG
jgi:hypothetical protein